MTFEQKFKNLKNHLYRVYEGDAMEFYAKQEHKFKNYCHTNGAGMETEDKHLLDCIAGECEVKPRKIVYVNFFGFANKKEEIEQLFGIIIR